MNESEVLRNVQTQTRLTLSIIKSALTKYTLHELSLSYNGGKDCLVLLILFLAALSTSSHDLPSALQSVYIISPHPFKEVDEFVDWSVKEWKLDLTRYSRGMKEGFEAYLKNEGKDVKAIMVGTRRTDPHGAELQHFQMTDKGWPEFMRIHPVIDWHYVEIWTVSNLITNTFYVWLWDRTHANASMQFIRYFKIPYCSLYDMGYTSLGGTQDTHPNPALKSGGEGQEKQFRPAYELVEDKAERLGRDWL